MTSGNQKGRAGRADRLRDALSILEAMDRVRNLHGAVSIGFFFASAGFSVVVFFVMTDLIPVLNDVTFQIPLSEYVLSQIYTIAWILIFPVWILGFLGLMSLRQTLGFRDVRAETRARLLDLSLAPEEVRELHAVIASRTWKHRQLFERAVADLDERRSES